MTMIDKVLSLVDERGLTQERLEAAAHLSHGRVSKWKRGTGEPKASEALRIARVLRCPVDWLIDDTAGGVVPAQPGLTEDERAVLDVYHATGLDRREAIRRLIQDGQGRQTAPVVGSVGQEFDPDTGRPPAKPRKGKTG